MQVPFLASFSSAYPIADFGAEPYAMHIPYSACVDSSPSPGSQRKGIHEIKVDFSDWKFFADCGIWAADFPRRNPNCNLQTTALPWLNNYWLQFNIVDTLKALNLIARAYNLLLNPDRVLSKLERGIYISCQCLLTLLLPCFNVSLGVKKLWFISVCFHILFA